MLLKQKYSVFVNSGPQNMKIILKNADWLWFVRYGTSGMIFSLKTLKLGQIMEEHYLKAN